MTAVNLPPPTSAPSPGGVGASFGLGGDRGAGGQADSSDGSTFDSVLGALDEPAPRTAPAGGAGPGETPASSGASQTSASPGSWRTLSAAHALGSGVLVAFDKRLDSKASAGTATDLANSASTATAPVGDGSGSPAAVASKGLASLIAGLTGMAPGAVGRPATYGATSAAGSGSAQAPRAAVRTPVADPIVVADPAAPAPAKPISAGAGAGAIVAAPTSREDSSSAPTPAADGATVVPDPAALATIGWSSLLLGAAAVTPASAATGGAARGAASAAATERPGSRAPIAVTRSSDVALATSAPPVEVKVVRSITYLGLDPTVRGIRPESGSPPAPLAAAASGPARQAPAGPVAPPVAASAPADGSSTPGGDQPGRNARGGFASGSGSAAPATAPAAPSDPIAVRAPAPGDLGALSSLGAAPVPLSQLADVIASAAAQMQPSGEIAASSTGAAGGASAATAPVKELDVKLNPASLGGLSIEMRLSDGKLAVTIKADKPDTQKLIEGERGALSDRLESLNFSVESLTVKASDGTAGSAATDASNPGTSSHGAAQQGQSGQGDPGARNGRSLGGDSRDQRAPGATLGEPGGVADSGERLF